MSALVNLRPVSGGLNDAYALAREMTIAQRPVARNSR